MVFFCWIFKNKDLTAPVHYETEFQFHITLKTLGFSDVEYFSDIKFCDVLFPTVCVLDLFSSKLSARGCNCHSNNNKPGNRQHGELLNNLWFSNRLGGRTEEFYRVFIFDGKLKKSCIIILWYMNDLFYYFSLKLIRHFNNKNKCFI